MNRRLFLESTSSGLSEYVFRQERETEWTKTTTQKRAEAGDPFRRTW